LETWLEENGIIMLGAICLLISSLCYLVAGIDFYRKDKVGAAIAFMCYAIANIAFLYELMKKE
jgi:hypothetical protein